MQYCLLNNNRKLVRNTFLFCFQLKPDNHVKITTQPDGLNLLIIEHAQPSDAGTYEVIATNPEGVQSSKGELSIADKAQTDQPQEPPKFAGMLRNLSIEEGKPLQLSAMFTGNPIPEVTWTKDGKVVAPSERTMITCDGKKVELEVNPSRPLDSGKYGCQLSNPFGSDETSSSVTVKKIYQKPSFSQRFTDLQQLPGCSAKFMGRVSGVPRPDVTWYFNGRVITPDDNKYKIKKDADMVCLYIKDCTENDAGHYTCKATNKEGEDSCDAVLEIVDRM